MDNSKGNIDSNSSGQNTDPSGVERNEKGQFIKAPPWLKPWTHNHNVKGKQKMSPKIKARAKAMADRTLIIHKETIKKQNNKITILQAKVSAEKNRTAKKAVLNKIRLIQKAPKYYWSVIGYPVLMQWCRDNSITIRMANIMVIMSYNRFMVKTDFPLWRISVGKSLYYLMKMGLVQSMELPSKNGLSRGRISYLLSPSGAEMVKAYERHHDEVFEMMAKSPNFNMSKYNMKNRIGVVKKKLSYRNVSSPLA